MMTRIGKRAELCQRIPEWKASILAQRLEDCRLLLSIKGYLRPSESDRIQRKIRLDFERGM
jgi:hypothetical protein